jgi:hypothetical protein
MQNYTSSGDRHFQNGHHNTAQIQHCPISTPFHVGRLWSPELISDNEKFPLSIHISNFDDIGKCWIFGAILEMATARNFSMSGINSGHHNLPTDEISLKSDNVEFVRWFLTLKNFYRSPFSKWPPQYRTNSTLSNFNAISCG